MKKKIISVFLSIMPLLAALISIICVLMKNSQAGMPLPYHAEFVGEYSYDGENWRTYTQESTLSASKEKVILRGQFSQKDLRNCRLYFYRNHIGVKIIIDGKTIYTDVRTELGSKNIKRYPSVCGKEWTYLFLEEADAESEVEIHLMNPHKTGNATAYRDFVENMYISGNNGEMMNAYLKPYIEPFKVLGGAFCILALMLFGAAVASMVMKSSVETHLLGLGTGCMFIGGYIIFDTMFLFDTDGLLAVNTAGRQICMMLGALALCWLTIEELSGIRKRIANGFLLGMAVWNTVLFALGTGQMLLFDTQVFWITAQALFCLLLISFGIAELMKKRAAKGGLGLYLMIQTAILADMVFVFEKLQLRGIITKLAVLVICVLKLAIAAKQLIRNYQDSVRAARLEAELTDMRIATMLSQIKPHFIYNTLGTIEQFCHEAPEKAADLVQKFSKYLRGNFTELDNVMPIRISQEMEHVRHYVSIEEIRFPDMEITYDLQAGEFLLPALSVQPLVENAIKHGLMGLESGGRVEILTYETEHAYCVEVRDNGIGFKKEVAENETKHVGLRNIRGRIEAMCKGTLQIESEEGKGTKALISIPKEGERCE